MSGIEAWPTSAGSVTDVDGDATNDGTNVQEGNAPRSVNNAIRALVANVAILRNLLGGAVDSAGTANAQTVTTGLSLTLTTLVDFPVGFRAGAGLTNTGAMTLAVDGTTAKSIKTQTGADPSAGAITAGGVYFVVYNGTNYTLLNPAVAAYLPLAGGAMTGLITNFASTGIDDDATEEVLGLADGGGTWGPATAASSFTQQRSVNDGIHGVAGGTSLGQGGNFLLYGATHGTRASDLLLRSGSTVIWEYDASDSGWECAVDIVVGSPTGGHKGAGTINAQAVYDDNSLLTPYVLEWARDGAVDLDALDAKVPDRQIEQKTFSEVTDDDGKVVGVEEVRTTRTEVRRHEPARKFLARIGTEYDPLDIDKYTKHWRDKSHLTSMPNPAKLASGSELSAGEWVQRLVETCEIQAIHIAELHERLKALEQSVAVR